MADEGNNGSRKAGYLKIAAGGKRYVYDKATNACVQISERVDSLLDEFIAHGADEVRQRYQYRMPTEELCVALECLDGLTTSHGMFQPSPTIDFSGFLCSDDFEQALVSPCHQLTLNVTEQCNQRCTYCVYSGNFQSERSHRNKEMTWTIAQKCIDYLLSRSQRHVNSMLDFYGGEPLLNWSLVKRCIAYARRSEEGRRLRITLNSNLTLLNDEIARFLVDHDVHISMSLDGPREVHDSARIFAGGGGTYDRVTRQLQKLIELDPEYCRKRLVIKCTDTLTSDIADLFRYFSQDSLKDLEVGLHPLREPNGGDAELPSKDQSARQKQLDQLTTDYLESVRAGKALNHRLFRRLFPTVYSQIARRPFTLIREERMVKRLCIPSVTSMFVSADGRFFTCENFSHPDNCIGSVETGIDTARVRALLETYVGFCEELCQQCWAERLCSQCFVPTLDGGRISKERMQQNCEWERKKIAKAFERFLYLWENEPASFRDSEFSLHSAVRQS